MQNRLTATIFRRAKVRTWRSGFTLMELLLVVSIIFMVGALATPAVLQTFARQTLDKGADKVRVAMGQARVRAIRDGDIYAVFILEGGAWYNVAPFSQAKSQAVVAGQRQQLAARRQQNDLDEDLLPRGISFASNVVAIDDRAAEALGVDGSDSTIRPILFYPDGTSQDAKLVIQNEKGQFVEIQLRGMTGLSSVVRLREAPQSR
jgi:prepilin-type N-terminal cleavage/methylation domain-containing protein